MAVQLASISLRIQHGTHVGVELCNGTTLALNGSTRSQDGYSDSNLLFFRLLSPCQLTVVALPNQPP
jgi:hypothetical protein